VTNLFLVPYAESRPGEDSGDSIGVGHRSMQKHREVCKGAR